MEKRGENITLPGGAYGFYPQVKYTVAGYIHNARQYYIQSSPPYDLGNGEVPLFVFAHIARSGQVESLYVASDPPWANNGPTNIAPDYVNAQGRGWRTRNGGVLLEELSTVEKRAEALRRIRDPWDEDIEFDEITPEYKNADMGLIPHPFGTVTKNESTIVLIDPVSDLVADLSLLHEQMGQSNESVAALFSKDYLQINNEALNRKGPQGVQIVEAKWKNER